MADDLPNRPEPPLVLAISDCLLGSRVRYDGHHARTFYPHQALSGLFEYRGICPEVAIGLGVPRAPIQLVERDGSIRATGVHNPHADVTQPLQRYGEQVASNLSDVAGYVFMKGSPSCGLYGVNVHPGQSESGRLLPERRGRGVFADVIVSLWPELPAEECGRLDDAVLRENFLTRTFVYAHWQAVCRGGLSREYLIAFHSRYRYLLMARSIPHYQRAERIVADLQDDFASEAGVYQQNLMAGFRQVPTRSGHAMVLAHLQGYLKRDLAASSRHELSRSISSYRRGEQPLQAALELLKHHLSDRPNRYLDYQTYLDPFPTARR
jgi:uncharacterized protein YbgA (DUF1722 family)/uncharacterized protein YbbK (DUF523 family)